MNTVVRGYWLPGRSGLAAAGVIAAIGLALFLWRIDQPGRLVFDESHYVPAARILNALAHPTNREHPLLAKWLIGWSIRLFGDMPAGWRTLGALFGGASLFATTIGSAWLFRSVRAGAMAGAFALLGQLLFVQARTAMLDVYLAAFVMLAFWMLAAASRAERGNRWRMVLAGLFCGCAVGTKWSAVPLVAAGVATLLVWRGIALADARRPLGRWLLDGDVGPVRGVSALEIAAWLGPFALFIYLATFIPAMLYAQDALPPGEVIAEQFRILAIQKSPMAPHPYQSVLWQWILDARPIWYFNERTDGAWRSVLLIGNPVVMGAGLIAVAVALVEGFRGRGSAFLAAALLYAWSCWIWLLIPKPVEFYYYYLLPSLFLGITLAGGLERLFLAKGRRAVPGLVIGASAIVFCFFYPILSAAALAGPQSFNLWMWLPSWR